MTSWVLPFIEIQDGGFELCNVSQFQVFPSRFAFVSNRTKTVLVTLTALNTRNLSKLL